MSEKDLRKEATTPEAVFKDTPSSPRYNKKAKYQAFRSDDDETSEDEEMEGGRIQKKRGSNKRQNTFKKKIGMGKSKKKDENVKEEKQKQKQQKEKEKQEKKEKRKSKGSSSVLSGDEGEARPETPMHGPVFGVTLEVAVERSSLPDGTPVPRVVRECIHYIEEKGLDAEGIYRVSGQRSHIESMKTAFNEGRDVNMDGMDPHAVAALLKLFLREMPSNVLTTRLAPIFDSCLSVGDEAEQVRRFQQLLNDLPVPNKSLLAWLFVHLGHVMDKESDTKMNIQNLSIVFSPTMGISCGVLNIFLSNIHELFPNEQLIKYVKPEIKADPVTIEDWQAVLEHDERILAGLHERVKQLKDGAEDNDLHEELWEMQRKVTQTKRKIKTLRRKEAESAAPAQSLSQPDLRSPTANQTEAPSHVSPETKPRRSHSQSESSTSERQMTPDFEAGLSASDGGRPEEESVDQTDAGACNADDRRSGNKSPVPPGDVDIGMVTAGENPSPRSPNNTPPRFDGKLKSPQRTPPRSPTENGAEERTLDVQDESQESIGKSIVDDHFSNDPERKSSLPINSNQRRSTGWSADSLTNTSADALESTLDASNDLSCTGESTGDALDHEDIQFDMDEDPSVATDRHTDKPANHTDEEEEIRLLLLEETRLLIEQEELAHIGEEWQRKIKRERMALERLEFELSELQLESKNSSSSNYSSNSSLDSSADNLQASRGSDAEGDTEDDNNLDDTDELESILKELEAEHDQLKMESNEWMSKINSEHSLVAQLKTDLRMLGTGERSGMGDAETDMNGSS